MFYQIVLKFLGVSIEQAATRCDIIWKVDKLILRLHMPSVGKKKKIKEGEVSPSLRPPRSGAEQIFVAVSIYDYHRL